MSVPLYLHPHKYTTILIPFWMYYYVDASNIPNTLMYIADRFDKLLTNRRN